MSYTSKITKTFDSLTYLKDAGLIAASAACQVDATNQILDLGTGIVKGDIVIDVSACEVDSDDEKYEIGVQISSSSDFSSDIYEIQTIKLGSAGTAAGDNLAGDTDMGIGRYVIPFENTIANSVRKQYMRLYVHVSGTVATGINFLAYLTIR
jgi:hypothetical protein